MADRVAKRPLDPAATKAASDQFYANHPEMIDAEGKRIPIHPSSAAHRAYRTEWMDLYVANGGALEGDDPAPAVEPKKPCEYCWIKFQALSASGDIPLAGVRFEITDPNGAVLKRVTDANGLISIAPAIPGAYAATSPIAGLTISEVFHQTAQASEGAPVTASKSEPPADPPRHVPPADYAAMSPQQKLQAWFPWHPKAIATIETVKVKSGDSLISLGERVGMQWHELAQFNFGTTRPTEINEQLRDLVGCTDEDRKGNFSFSDTDDPGLMFLPTAIRAEGLEINKVHIFRAEPLRRPVKIELQTVDGLGYRLGGQKLKLYGIDGNAFALTTDATGYWTDTIVTRGPVDAYLDGGETPGERLHFFADTYRGADQKSEEKKGVEDLPWARIDPLLYKRAITDILIPGKVDDAVLARRDTLRRRYGRTHADYAAAKKVSEETGQDGGEASAKSVDVPQPQAAPLVRGLALASDSAYTAAEWPPNTEKRLQAFASETAEWLADRHPTTGGSARGQYQILICGKAMVLVSVSSSNKAKVEHVIEMGGELAIYGGQIDAGGGNWVKASNRVGAYAMFESGGQAKFADLETRSVQLIPFASGGRQIAIDRIVETWELAKNESDQEKIRAFTKKQGGKVAILYLLPQHETDALIIARYGGPGLLENYPADSAVRARAHARNLRAVEMADRGYGGLLKGYIEKVEKTKTARELQKLGPPPEPFRFATPAGATDDEAIELFKAARRTSFEGWKAVSEHLDALENRHSAGSIFLRTKFELSSTLENKYVGGGTGKISFNFDIGSDGYLQKTERAVEVAAGPNGVNIPGLKSTGTAQYKVEINADTGERKETLALALKRGPHTYGFESSSDGNLKFLGPYGSYSEWNQRSAEGGFGFCLSLQDLLGRREAAVDKAKSKGIDLPANTLDRINGAAGKSIPNATFCFGLHFVLIREDQILSYIVRAPGFFERRLLEDLPRVNWNSLDGLERAQLTVIGWDMETWDRRLPEDFPACTAQDYSELEAKYKVAAVKLGLNQLNWTQFWGTEKALANGRKQLMKQGR